MLAAPVGLLQFAMCTKPIQVLYYRAAGGPA